MGSAVYLFRKVARNAPRIIHGDVTAMGNRLGSELDGGPSAHRG